MQLSVPHTSINPALTIVLPVALYIRGRICFYLAASQVRDSIFTVTTVISEKNTPFVLESL